MATDDPVQHWLDQLAGAEPGFWTWLQGHPRYLDQITHVATHQFFEQGQGYEAFYGWLQGESQIYAQYAAGTTPPSPEPPPPSPEPPPPSPEPPPPPPPAPDQSGDLLGAMLLFLQENDLPTSLLSWIQNEIAQNKPYDQIIAELRMTPEYLAAYPENAMRAANGFSWMTESWIRNYRDEARRIAQDYLNIDISNSEIANLIANDRSLTRWESDLQTWTAFERWGPVARQVLEQELGYTIPDDRTFAFLSPDIPTPELDRAYDMALLRTQPASVGLGVRPEEEAAMLRQYGLSPEQAFAGYQGIAGELPKATRMAAIEAQIATQSDKFPTGNDLFNDTPFSTLFRAIQLQDPTAMATLQGEMAREVARFQAVGGVASSGGVGIGALTEAERQAM